MPHGIYSRGQSRPSFRWGWDQGLPDRQRDFRVRLPFAGASLNDPYLRSICSKDLGAGFLARILLGPGHRFYIRRPLLFSVRPRGGLRRFFFFSFNGPRFLPRSLWLFSIFVVLLKAFNTPLLKTLCFCFCFCSAWYVVFWVSVGLPTSEVGENPVGPRADDKGKNKLWCIPFSGSLRASSLIIRASCLKKIWRSA